MRAETENEKETGQVSQEREREKITSEGGKEKCPQGSGCVRVAEIEQRTETGDTCEEQRRIESSK